MGQYFRLYNLDKRQYMEFSFGTKLGEFYFGKDPIRVLELFNGARKGNWCNDRVICFGDYASSNDLPDGLLSNDEFEKLEFEKETVHYKKRVNGEIVQKEKMVWEPEGIFSHLEGIFRVVRIPKVTIEDHAPYVLRNISKKEYIVGDKTKARDGTTLLGYCLFARICWSSDSDSSLSDPYHLPSITRGEWAGDKFDLVLFEDVQDVLNDEKEGWKDVSNVMKRWVLTIFKENDMDWA